MVDNSELMYGFDTLIDPDAIAKISGKNILLYDLNVASKLAFLWFQAKNIYVAGFVLDNDRRDLEGLRYFNKRVFFLEDLQDAAQDFVIVDVSDKNSQKIQSKIKCSVYSLFKELKPVIFYTNSSEYADYATNILRQIGVPVLKVACPSELVDTIRLKSNIEIISQEILQHDYSDVDVVVNVDPRYDARERRDADVAKELVQSGVSSHCRLYNHRDFSFTLDIKFSNGERGIGIVERTVYYYLCQIHQKHTRLLFLGNMMEVVDCLEKMCLLDVRLVEGISSDGFVGRSNDISFISAYDLLYSQQQNYVVAVLPSGIDFASKFIEETGVNSSKFLHVESGENIYPVLSLDPNLGHNLKESLVITPRVASDISESSAIRIGVSGGSTSDMNVYPEKTWVEHLYDVAKKSGFDIVIVNGAIKGYTSSHELNKFVRDMSHLRLDIMLSYSGVNEGHLPNVMWGNPSISSYQEDIFRLLAKAKSSNFRHNFLRRVSQKNNFGVCWGCGISDYAENWIQKERMMYAICRELGTKFYGILQPYILGKINLSLSEKELLEHVITGGSDNYAHRYQVMKDIAHKIRSQIDVCPWFVDFSSIFDDEYDVYLDDCHLFSKGNRILAEKVFALIKNDLVEILEEKRHVQ